MMRDRGLQMLVGSIAAFIVVASSIMVYRMISECGFTNLVLYGKNLGLAYFMGACN